jgi:hypothetical protein
MYHLFATIQSAQPDRFMIFVAVLKPSITAGWIVTAVAVVAAAFA